MIISENMLKINNDSDSGAGHGWVWRRWLALVTVVRLLFPIINVCWYSWFMLESTGMRIDKLAMIKQTGVGSFLTARSGGCEPVEKDSVYHLGAARLNLLSFDVWSALFDCKRCLTVMKLSAIRVVPRKHFSSLRWKMLFLFKKSLRRGSYHG